MAHVHSEFHSEFHFVSPSAPAFAFASESSPSKRADLDPPTHVLLARETLAPGEFELQNGEAIEIVAIWGSTVLFARHVAPSDGFVIGESSSSRRADFELSTHELGASSVQLVELRDGMPYVAVPSAARVRVKQAAEPYATHSAANRVALLTGTVVELEFGRLSFRIANVPRGQHTPREVLAKADRSVLAAYALSFTIGAALLSAFAFWMPPLGLTDGEELDRERLETMKQYLTAQAERDREEPPATGESGKKDAQPGAPAESAAGREGALGKPTASASNHRAAVRGAAPEVQLSHSRMLEAARSFGMIEVLGSLPVDAGGGSPFVRDPSLGHDATDAEGGMWGDPGDSAGVGGLRLSGGDQGGGGHGAAVALGGIGTCTSGSCGRAGMGGSVGRIGGVYHPVGVRIRPLGDTVTGGRLPPEVVQRIVRQNFGRFRLCYENGLRANPNLTGRVTARFVIGRDGAVSNASNGGSDLPDSAVVSCVIQAFYGLSFPTPENGIVTVNYPIMLSPG